MVLRDVISKLIFKKDKIMGGMEERRAMRGLAIEIILSILSWEFVRDLVLILRSKWEKTAEIRVFLSSRE
jgi:hypothetical protein